MKFGKKQILPVLILLLLFSIGTTTGTVIAKYVTERELTEQITFTAELAEKMVLEEYKVTRTPEGDYDYETQPETNHYITAKSNSYVLMPGVDIKKDPYIRITDKTDIEAYLFLEIVGHQPGAADNGVSYELMDPWKPAMSGTGTDEKAVSPKHGGTVYVYSDENGPVKIKKDTLTTKAGIAIVKIIKDGTVTVSQKLEKDADLEIKFYAVMAEVVEGKSLAEIYNDAVTIPETP